MDLTFLLELVCIILYIDLFITSAGPSIRDSEARQNAIKMVKHALAVKEGSVPHVSIAKLLPCLSQYNIISVRMLSKSPFAYVFMLSKNIFVNRREWLAASVCSRSHALIHECSHVELNSRDYAYAYEPHYQRLRGKEAANNADTITTNIELMSNMCI